MFSKYLQKEERKEGREGERETQRPFLFSGVSVKWDIDSIYTSRFKETSLKCFKILGEKPACLVTEI